MVAHIFSFIQFVFATNEMVRAKVTLNYLALKASHSVVIREQPSFDELLNILVKGGDGAIPKFVRNFFASRVECRGCDNKAK